MAVEEDHVNRETHTERVNHIATREQHQLPRQKTVAPKQALSALAGVLGHETLPRSIAELDYDCFQECCKRAFCERDLKGWIRLIGLIRPILN